MNITNRSRLQQQPHRVVNRQQQQSSGSREFQPRKSQSLPPPDRPTGQMGEMGEGKLEATRGFQDNS